MKKRSASIVFLVLAILVLSLCLAGCSLLTGTSAGKNIEDIDKSTRLLLTSHMLKDTNITTGDLQYIKDGVLYTVPFDLNVRHALDFLKSNAKPGEKVLSWWENGHAIRGYTRREPIIYAPTRDLLTKSVVLWREDSFGPFAESADDATNVAYALLADSPKVAQGILKRYGAKWVFVAKTDKGKLEGMTSLIGEDYKSYLDDLGEPKEAVKSKVLFKMADGWPVQGFELKYEDEYASVYVLQ